MSNLNKTVLVLAFVAGAFGSVSAKDVKWIGDDGGDWDVGDNWEGGEKPGDNDTAVFTGENGTSHFVGFTYNANLWGFNIGSIRVEGGDWYIGAPARAANGQRDVSTFFKGDGEGGPAVVDVAEGAKLVCSNKVVPVSHDTQSFLKTGAGSFAFGVLGENSRRWASITIRGAAQPYWGGSSLATTNLIVGVGVEMALDSGGYPNYGVKGNPSVHVEEGAIVRLYKETFDGVSGPGTVAGDGNNGSVTLNLARGPYRFDGTFGGTKNLGVTFAAQGETPDEAYQLVVGSGDAFAKSAPVKFEAGGVHPLKFASGVGTFYLHMLGGKVGAPLELVDLAGEPVTLVVDRHSTAQDAFGEFPGLRFTGSGTFITQHRIDDGSANYDFWGRSYTNDVFKGLTGTLGVQSTMGDLFVGDNDAAHDADLNTVSAVKVMTSGAKFKSQNVEKNSHDWALDVVYGGMATFDNRVTLKGPVTGAGTLTLSGADSSVEDLRGDESHLMFVTASKDVALQTKDVAILEGVKATAGNMSVTFSNGVFRGAYAANGDSYKIFDIWYPKGLNLYGGSDVTRKFVVERDATVWLAGTGYGDRHPSYLELRNGGTLCQRSSEGYGTKVTGHTVFFDGGTYVFCPAGNVHGSGQWPTSTEDWLFQVGAGGGTLDYDFVNKFSLYESRASVGLYAAFAPDPSTGASGAFHFRTPAQLLLNAPVGLAGEVYLDEGIIRFRDNDANREALANGAIFGTGDIHLGQAMLDFGIYPVDCTPKLGANPGQRFYYDAGSLVIGRREDMAAQTITFGNGSGAPFVRGGRGAALLLIDREKQSVFDGSGAKFLAAEGCTVALNAETGLVDEPVFGYAYRSGASDFGAFTFLTYDASKGFVETSAYVTNDLARGGVATLDTEDQTLAADASVAALRLDAVKLTVNQDVTLKVGPDDAAKTAQVLFNTKNDASWSGKYNGYVKGKGTIDFGASEAVLVVDILDRGYSSSCGIGCTITGSGGLSFVGNPIHTLTGFEISGENKNTGDIYVSGTDLRVRHARALGDATVYVNGSRLGGGGVRFYTAGTYANDFYVDGHGPRRGENTAPDYGCLVFTADVTLSGDIHIARRARISDTAATSGSQSSGGKPGHGTIAGVISGGMLDISGPENANYPTNRLDLCGANTYTGGTFVAFHNVVVSGAGTLGTGPVTLSNGGYVTFDYATARTVPNDWIGFGTVRVAGSGEVSFTGKVEPSDACDIALDLAGTNPTLKGLPDFKAIVNSTGGRVKLTLTGDAVLGADRTFEGDAVNLVLDGATLDLSGRTIDVRRLTCQNGGKVVNGTVNELNPAKGLLLIVR